MPERPPANATGCHWPLRVLAVLLLGWEPLAFALYASSILDRVVDRGPLAATLLMAHVIVLGVGIAAGLAIWNRRGGALPLARTAVALAACAAAVNAATGALPHNQPPGVGAVLTAGLLAYYGAWFAYLSWLARRA
jgi:hypothetical protein